MREAFLRVVWFIIVASALSYVGILIAGSLTVRHEADPTGGTILVRDLVAANSHRLTGQIMVPSPCDELSARSQQLSTTTYVLLFTTWREPSVRCTEEAASRSFSLQIFAPAAGISIIALLDGTYLPILVTPINSEH